MDLNGQTVLPAIRNMKAFEKFLEMPYQYGVILEIHVSQLRNVFQMAQNHRKKLFIHADLINGLKNDEYATEFLCQEFKPYGIISTRAAVITKAKAKGVLAIQRIFLLDSQALEKSYSLIQKTEPDYIELLPGTMLEIITEVAKKISVPILAGGFIRKVQEVDNVLEAGAAAATSSSIDLWKHYLSTKK
ncbi:glycerol-3-phosphate responsive antiterminator [Peribacillus sp. SCS-155]|uniref:glycerol-3-phosphate responsive antiterminator n=1 Tax=Peribacillus sedimenti TaxID=3115297 RepID=UPI0039067A78